MTENEFIEIDTSYGRIKGIHNNRCNKYLGVRYARAGRFEYSTLVDSVEGVYDATCMGNACPQSREWFEHLDNPERLFYHNEFRKGIKFNYDEDCLNLNIYAPLTPGPHPVIIFVHGGGFNSGANSEGAFDGTSLAEEGIVTVCINYRVGILGYLTHEDIKKEYGRDGNFGMDDILQAIRWVRKHISSFGGDRENITLMGQSAGAISIQYLVINKGNSGLFRRAIMISGAGLFPSFSLPRKAEGNHEYWLELMKKLDCNTLEDLRKIGIKELFEAVEVMKGERKDTVYHTMPVVDGAIIPDEIGKLIKKPLKIDYMIGYTNNDMYAPILAHIGNVFARNNGGYRYFFDIDAPGDDNKAFHSSDLRYVFGTLDSSWRNYSERDYEVSREMTGYIASFASTGNPNRDSLPSWKRKGVMCFRKKETKMGHPSFFKMTCNFLFKGSPKTKVN